MQPQIDELTKQLNSTNGYLDAAKAAIAELTKQLDSTNGFVDKLTTRVTKLEAGSSPLPSDGTYELKKVK